MTHLVAAGADAKSHVMQQIPTRVDPLDAAGGPPIWRCRVTCQTHESLSCAQALRSASPDSAGSIRRDTRSLPRSTVR